VWYPEEAWNQADPGGACTIASSLPRPARCRRSPMPPFPIGARISYGPSASPGDSGIRLIQFSVADEDQWIGPCDALLVECSPETPVPEPLYESPTTHSQRTPGTQVVGASVHFRSAPQTHPLANTLKPQDIFRPTIGVKLSLATRPSILAGESSVV
jgi:hypothetical protein